MSPAIINFVYIVASVLFIIGIKMLGKAETARKGNVISAVGMLIAIVVTLFDRQILDAADPKAWAILAGTLILGTVIGAVIAKKVKMTAMPEMVESAKKACENAGFKNIYETRAGGTIASHCGGNTLGILYFNDGAKK